MSRPQQYALLALGFTIGIAVMGMQMVLSRLLAPYFGSDIFVWAALISMTMLAMMVGYYVGGRLADRYPQSRFLGAAVLIAALYLAIVPWAMSLELFAEPDPVFPGLRQNLLDWLSKTIDFLPLGAITAAFLLLFAPFTLLSFFSPFCIRLLIEGAGEGGKISGSVYAITTFGNIIGVLGTGLGLMSVIHSYQAIIWTMTALLAVCGVGLAVLNVRANSQGRPSAAAPDLPHAA